MLEQGLLMEGPGMQKLFEELDRFDDSNAMPDISVSRKNIKIVNTIFSKNMDLEACSSEAANLDTSRILFTLESIKLDLKKASAIARNPAHNLQKNETENLGRSKENRDDEAWSTVGRRLVGLGGSVRELLVTIGVVGLWGEARWALEDVYWEMNLGLGKPNLVKSSKALKGGEGMESLWEAYEEDTMNKISRSSKKKKNVKNYKSKSEFKYFDDGVSEDGDKDDQFMGNGQLCCFKALKMSTGKMNLGMGKPNLVKISKALKGFGWLHHRHAKKC
ncbi:hypothetical protein Tco_0700447 [Tanacetum coccineum]